MPSPIALTDTQDDARYRALKARDARFDGHFFTAVTSTGIYCRPVCRVRTPRRENCRFFFLAAQAESAGFRPCLRCRPELAPAPVQGAPSGTDSPMPWSMQDASAILARQAAHMFDAPGQWGEARRSMVTVAARLGVSERHLRRIFESQWGVSPIQYWQTRRLLTAKQLLTDTSLPVPQIAMLSGYSSVRRFNAAFVTHYQLQPRALRKTASTLSHSPIAAGANLKASYRPPYDVQSLLQFFARRQVAGIESVDLARQSLARTLSIELAGRRLNGWVRLRFDTERYTVHMEFSESLVPALPQVFSRVRILLDLDADPQAINATLATDFPACDGLRVPGTLDGFELAVRAILGQQITVAAARTLANRLVNYCGEAIQTPFEGVNRLFPTPPALACASSEALGQLGIVRQRQCAIQALARAVDNGTLALRPDVNVQATLVALQALPGIGPWTANYIAMRALHWPDAFPSGDVALQKALGVKNAKNPQQAAEQASERWKPWRSYAVVRAWNSLSNS